MPASATATRATAKPEHRTRHLLKAIEQLRDHLLRAEQTAEQRLAAIPARRRPSASVFSSNVCTASCRRAMAAASHNGCESQSRSRRAPIGVTVRLSAP